MSQLVYDLTCETAIAWNSTYQYRDFPISVVSNDHDYEIKDNGYDPNIDRQFVNGIRIVPDKPYKWVRINSITIDDNFDRGAGFTIQGYAHFYSSIFASPSTTSNSKFFRTPFENGEFIKVPGFIETDDLICSQDSNINNDYIIMNFRNRGANSSSYINSGYARVTIDYTIMEPTFLNNYNSSFGVINNLNAIGNFIFNSEETIQQQTYFEVNDDSGYLVANQNGLYTFVFHVSTWRNALVSSPTNYTNIRAQLYINGVSMLQVPVNASNSHIVEDLTFEFGEYEINPGDFIEVRWNQASVFASSNSYIEISAEQSIDPPNIIKSVPNQVEFKPNAVAWNIYKYDNEDYSSFAPYLWKQIPFNDIVNCSMTKSLLDVGETNLILKAKSYYADLYFKNNWFAERLVKSASGEIYKLYYFPSNANFTKDNQTTPQYEFYLVDEKEFWKYTTLANTQNGVAIKNDNGDGTNSWDYSDNFNVVYYDEDCQTTIANLFADNISSNAKEVANGVVGSTNDKRWFRGLNFFDLSALPTGITSEFTSEPANNLLKAIKDVLSDFNQVNYDFDLEFIGESAFQVKARLANSLQLDLLNNSKIITAFTIGKERRDNIDEVVGFGKGFINSSVVSSNYYDIGIRNKEEVIDFSTEGEYTQTQVDRLTRLRLSEDKPKITSSIVFNGNYFVGFINLNTGDYVDLSLGQNTSIARQINAIEELIERDGISYIYDFSD